MADWFTSFAQQALKLADDIADSIVSQANDAQQQLQDEQLKLQDEERKRQETLNNNQLLPWDTSIESRQILTNSLMEKILSLSLQEDHFSLKSPNADEIEFNFQDFIPIALKLLQLDSNLARVHSKLSPKMNEELFWFNYYCRVRYLRSSSGIDGPMAQKEVEKWKVSDIIIESPSVPFHSKTPSTPSMVEVSSTPKTPASTKIIYNDRSSKNSVSSPSIGDIGSTPTKEEVKKRSESDEIDLEIENLNDLELDELGDINPEDFEEIGSSECMDELEAQIAKELEEERLKKVKSSK